jgi:hypothetical protein
VIALALDPGVTTGYCIGLLEENKLWVAPHERKFSLAELYDYLNWFSPYDIFVVYEDFQYRNAPRAGLDLTPVKMIGIIELFAESGDHSQQWYYKQTPAQGKGFFTDQRLKDMGVYKVGKAHGRDATRHLLQWYTFGAGSRYKPDDDVYEMIEPGDIYEKIRES